MLRYNGQGFCRGAKQTVSSAMCAGNTHARLPRLVDDLGDASVLHPKPAMMHVAPGNIHVVAACVRSEGRVRRVPHLVVTRPDHEQERHAEVQAEG